MEIDLASAPKDATHYKPNNPGMPFRMEDGGSWYAWESDEENWIEIVDPTPGEYLPINAPWSGEGLPPVGARIEYRSKDGCDPKEWTAVYVLAHAKHGHDDAMLLAEESSGDCKHGKMYGRIWMPGTCRVARTEEQIAADREIEALAKDIMAEQHVSGRVLAERLHALGYRKTEGGAA